MGETRTNVPQSSNVPVVRLTFNYEGSPLKRGLECSERKKQAGNRPAEPTRKRAEKKVVYTRVAPQSAAQQPQEAVDGSEVGKPAGDKIS